MPDLATLLRFGLASLALALTPGPSVVLVVTVGTDRGRWSAVTVALGLAVGTSAWVVAAAAGLGALLAARPGALAVVTAAGGCYLITLAARRLVSVRDGSDDLAEMPSTVVAATSGLVDGAVVNLLNPSLALFLAALLPPFIDPVGASTTAQILVLGAVLVGVSTVVNVGWGLLGAGAGRRVRERAGSRRTTLVAAAVYAALGVFALVAALR